MGGSLSYTKVGYLTSSSSPEVSNWMCTMTKHSVKAKTKSMHGIEKCRVSEIGVENYAECLQRGPNTCPHALPFGYCFLCRHPRLDQIMENTKKAALIAEVLK